MTQKTFTLILKNGTLYFPHGGSDAMNGDWDVFEYPSLLLRRYPAGDCDTCRYPFVPAEYSDDTEHDLRVRLAFALYDERECNAYFPDDAVILLPNGERFDFDWILSEDEDQYPSGHQREYDPDNYRGF